MSRVLLFHWNNLSFYRRDQVLLRCPTLRCHGLHVQVRARRMFQAGPWPTERELSPHAWMRGLIHEPRGRLPCEKLGCIIWRLTHAGMLSWGHVQLQRTARPRTFTRWVNRWAWSRPLMGSWLVRHAVEETFRLLTERHQWGNGVFMWRINLARDSKTVIVLK